MTTLLRKKAAPEVVEWVEDSKKKSTDILLKDDEELTKWAARLTVDCKEKYNFSGFYTKEEQAQGKGDEKEDMEMQDRAISALGVDQILKFMYQGELPK